MKDKKIYVSIRRAASWLLAVSLIVGTLCLYGCEADEYAINNGSASAPAVMPARPGSYAELFEKVSGISPAGVFGYGGMSAFNGVDDLAVEEDGAETTMEFSAMANSSPAAAIGVSDHSETNVQVEGVDEGDIIKTDGKYIYMLRSRRLTIADAAGMTESCTIMPDLMEYANPYEMYISDDTLVLIADYDLWYKAYVLGELKDSDDTYAPEEIPQGYHTSVMIFDISDRSAPKLTNTLSQDGSYVSSRMTGGMLYCVSNDFLYSGLLDENRPETYVPCVGTDGGTLSPLPIEDICLFDDCVDSSYNVITSIDIKSASQHASAKAAFGRSGTVYSDGKVILIAASLYKSDKTEGKYNGKNAVINEYTHDTDLMLYSLDNGDIELIGKGTIPGSLVNQFAIDRYKGSFRFVTTINKGREIIYTDGVDTYDYENAQSCALFTTDGNLNIVGSIEDLARDEQVYSVRFDGDTAYFVTFRQVDPLFCADLSDPKHPVILGQLKIPGFSQYMHKYSDTLLFGLGRDADTETGAAKGLKLSMFDISDPADISEKYKLITDLNYSEALYNHKAILVSREKGIIAFPVDRSYVVYKFDEDSGFSAVCTLETNEWSALLRGLFIGDDFYICTEKDICRYDMNNEYVLKDQLFLTEIPDNYFHLAVDEVFIEDEIDKEFFISE